VSNKEFIVRNGLVVTGDANITNPTLLVAGQNVLASIVFANNYAGAMANSSNGYIDTSTTSANNYAGVMANSVNAYTSATYSTLTQFGSVFGVSNGAFDKANSANVLAYNTGIGANAYADLVGTSGNNYAGVMANSVNAYTSATYSTLTQLGQNWAVTNAAFGVANAAYGQANTLKTSANAYADLVGTSANNYAGVMANASNTYAASLTPNLSPPFNVANAAFDKANSANVLAFNTGVGANAYATAVGTAGNTYAATVGTNANNYSNATFLKLTAASQTITGDFSISGNLFIGGNTTSVSANNFIVNDPLIYLANGNPSDIIDIGFIGSYINGTSAYVHTGLYREHTDKEYYLFQGYDADPINNHIGALSNNMTLSVLNANIRTSNHNLGGANAITWITSGFGVANAAYGQANTLATSANAYAASVGVSANAYAVTVGTSGNAFATAVGTAGNAYAVTVGTSGNNYAATVGTSSNNYAGAMANSGNSWASATFATITTVGTNATSANNFAGVMANSVNAYTTATYATQTTVATNATSANNYAGAMANSGNAWTQTIVDANLITARAYTNTSTTAANNYAGVMANSANAIATATYSTLTQLGQNWAVTNAAFGVANNAYTSTNGTAAFAFANGVSTNAAAAFAAANAEFTFSNTIYAAVNSAFAVINAAYTSSNADYVVSNAAFARGNTSAQLAFFRVAANGSNLDAASNADTLTIRSSNNIILIANSTNDSIQITQNPSGVTATTYGGATQVPSFVVDTYGRITSAANVAVSGMDYPYTNTSTTSANNYAGAMANSGNTWATATFATIANAAASFAAANARVSSVSGTAGRISSSGGTTPAIDLASGVVTATAATGGISALTVDTYGRVTAVTGSAGYVTSSGVTSVAAGTGLSGGTITTTGTISLPSSGPGGTGGSYSGGISALTIDAQGRVTAATGSAGYGTGTVTSVTAAAPLLSSGGTTPQISLPTTANVQILSLGVGTAASTVTGEIRATNNVTAYYSDGRLKTIISTIPSPVEKIKQISGVIYVNNDVAKSYGYGDESEQIGVIAQEVKKVLPQIIKLAPFDTKYVDGKEVSISGENYMTVQYEKIIPLLIEAIKEQQKSIDKLNKKINELQKK
jgi:hypothetical protein